MTSDTDCLIVVLTKDPVPGKVKTRLVPELGAAVAARLHASLVHRTLDLVLQSGLRAQVSLDGDLNGVFANTIRDRGFTVRAQSGGDLGARLVEALGVRDPSTRRIALGTDAPGLQASWLLDAARMNGPVVLGPAVDGGYWLIGVPSESRGGLGPDVLALFRDMPWSTSALTRVTLQRAHQVGLHIDILPTSYDVDRPADLQVMREDPHCPPSLLQFLEKTAPAPSPPCPS
ncbi:MAG: TIGR04282 family arsenosugar biosynthesis glycosyltransferase [Myxococcota bacterium]|jgi:hypothetical protein|nr:TIGR04282 family arsenosugar biosynthesis glycosyltransferase [Myxococcota bacterium]